MEGKPSMTELGNNGEATVSIPQPTQAPRKPEANVAGCTREVASESGLEGLEYHDRGARSSAPQGPTEAMGDSQGQAFSQDRSGMGESGSGSDREAVHCEDQGGSEWTRQTQGGWHSGAGPQQMHPRPDLPPYYVPYRYHPGYYGSPPFGMGGPEQRPHAGAGHHPGCFNHFPGMHGHQPQSPHFGPEPGTGYCYAEPPDYSGHDARNFNQISDMVGKALQGQANRQDLISGLLNLNFSGEQFWKGVVVGSVAAVLFNSDSVRQALMGALSGLFGKPEEKAQTDDRADQKA